QGLALEAAEHEGEPPVLGDVGGGLALAAGQVEVADAGVAEDAEGVQALGRKVDPPPVRRRGVEVNVLGGDEPAEDVVQPGVELGHGGGTPGVRRRWAGRSAASLPWRGRRVTGVKRV